MEVQYFPILPVEAKEGKFTVKKVSTNDNPADLRTKAMNGGKVKYLAGMGFDVDCSRANTVSTL